MALHGYSDLLSRARERGPFADDAAALRSFSAVLQTIRGELMPEERESLASALPGDLAQILRQPAPQAHRPATELIAEVASTEGIGAGRALEHLQVVGQILSEIAGPERRALLSRALPELASSFEPREDSAPPIWPSDGGAPELRDLAEGRPGGSHPIASANPAQAAHRHSLARAADPHADTKLSSTRGITQEREGDTLASGRPGSKRPLSSGH